MIEAILFDFDGTLIDTLPLYIKAYDKALRKEGFVLSKKEIAQKCFGKKEEFICTSLGIPEKAEVFRDNYYSAINDLFVDARLFDTTVQILDFLSINKVKLAIVTFASRWYIEKMLKQCGLEKYFEAVISSSDVTQPKPHPEAVLKATALLDVKPEKALVVGDSASDILMGKSAGSKAALFTRKEYDLFYSLHDLKKAEPDFIIHDLLDLKKMVKFPHDC